MHKHFFIASRDIHSIVTGLRKFGV